MKTRFNFIIMTDDFIKPTVLREYKTDKKLNVTARYGRLSYMIETEITNNTKQQKQNNNNPG